MHYDNSHSNVRHCGSMCATAPPREKISVLRRSDSTQEKYSYFTFTNFFFFFFGFVGCIVSEATIIILCRSFFSLSLPFFLARKRTTSSAHSAQIRTSRPWLCM